MKYIAVVMKNKKTLMITGIAFVAGTLAIPLGTFIANNFFKDKTFRLYDENSELYFSPYIIPIPGLDTYLGGLAKLRPDNYVSWYGMNALVRPWPKGEWLICSTSV